MKRHGVRSPARYPYDNKTLLFAIYVIGSIVGGNLVHSYPSWDIQATDTGKRRATADCNVEVTFGGLFYRERRTRARSLTRAGPRVYEIIRNYIAQFSLTQFETVNNAAGKRERCVR